MSEQFNPEGGATPERAEMLNDIFTKTENLIGAVSDALKEAGVPEGDLQEKLKKFADEYYNSCFRDAGSKLVSQEVAQEADIMHYFITGGMKPDYYGWKFRDTLEKK